MMHISVEEIQRDLSASRQRGKEAKTRAIGRAGQAGALRRYEDPRKAGHSIASNTYRQRLGALTRSWQVIDF